MKMLNDVVLPYDKRAFHSDFETNCSGANQQGFGVDLGNRKLCKEQRTIKKVLLGILFSLPQFLYLKVINIDCTRRAKMWSKTHKIAWSCNLSACWKRNRRCNCLKWHLICPNFIWCHQICHRIERKMQLFTNLSIAAILHEEYKVKIALISLFWSILRILFLRDVLEAFWTRDWHTQCLENQRFILLRRV